MNCITHKRTHQALLRRGSADVLRRSDEYRGRIDDALDPLAGEAEVVRVEVEGLGHGIRFELERRSDEGDRREHDELLEPFAGDEIRQEDGPLGRVKRDGLLDPVLQRR